MQVLVTRFHMLLLVVTLAITGVGMLRVPPDFVFPAHWTGNAADWLWPRNILFVAPAVQLLLMAVFFCLGRVQTKAHYAKTQHILDPALTLVMAVVAATQLGLLLTGIGSDLDVVRLTVLGLGIILIGLGIILAEAERHTYAGLRMPWKIASDHAWKLVHRIAGVAFGLSGAGLLLLAWQTGDLGPLVLALPPALLVPAALAGLATLATDRP